MAYGPVRCNECKHEFDLEDHLLCPKCHGNQLTALETVHSGARHGHITPVHRLVPRTPPTAEQMDVTHILLSKGAQTPPDNDRRRSAPNHIRVPDIFELEHACRIVTAALGETVYLVGSATERDDFTDIDLRVIMADEKFDALFGANAAATELTPFWTLLCTSITHYLRHMTGLPIDFQIQRRTQANERYKGGQRHPLCLGYDPFKAPAWRAEGLA